MGGVPSVRFVCSGKNHWERSPFRDSSTRLVTLRNERPPGSKKGPPGSAAWLYFRRIRRSRRVRRLTFLRKIRAGDLGPRASSVHCERKGAGLSGRMGLGLNSNLQPVVGTPYRQFKGQKN
jgi:hypothetical protein